MAQGQRTEREKKKNAKRSGAAASGARPGRAATGGEALDAVVACLGGMEEARPSVGQLLYLRSRWMYGWVDG